MVPLSQKLSYLWSKAARNGNLYSRVYCETKTEPFITTNSSRLDRIGERFTLETETFRWAVAKPRKGGAYVIELYESRPPMYFESNEKWYPVETSVSGTFKTSVISDVGGKPISKAHARALISMLETSWAEKGHKLSKKQPFSKKFAVPVAGQRVAKGYRK